MTDDPTADGDRPGPARDRPRPDGRRRRDDGRRRRDDGRRPGSEGQGRPGAGRPRADGGRPGTDDGRPRTDARRVDGRSPDRSDPRRDGEHRGDEGRGRDQRRGQSRARRREDARGAGAGRSATPIVRLEHVYKRYDTGGKTLTALADADLQVFPGEFVSVMGPSGSGKTTMLNLLGLLDEPSEGVVRVDGTDVTDFSGAERTRQRRRTVGFVFQDFYLLESLTARENVEVPALFADTDVNPTDRAERLLELVGLGDRTDHYPNELSGGQKQRVAIARSLINDPDVVLADEPTGNLDGDTSRQILGLLSRICGTGAAVVAVTHDPLVGEYAGRQVNVVDGHLSREGGPGGGRGQSRARGRPPRDQGRGQQRDRGRRRR